ncbi:hypothetical protein J056_003799 [Wallemia ichthyophaga EXF-994]|uniref:Uncharacterized protein n=1 Tax=Wallemia ichthyophaga (strain EXF-994 / CBS 113033) TaxID=1299270 RepID=R9AIU3_WALI9|nr:uncharacterized protein J056_003799 [Wallemia ichthyophaga EXF-994]EOR02123.1 hypothetical protein J056_003799 [Wallemia ichthyophaga EXF-994]TIA69259.1 hypothetical protein E3P91_03701 [Wallemia ichthyophaga]TIB29492.1 hypothetical protein E3P84_03685 [Wallemia ichthyophaga]TIB39113.1 hypothetical protein E3P83_03657 [Wallemia ichthyophaga]
MDKTYKHINDEFISRGYLNNPIEFNKLSNPSELSKLLFQFLDLKADNLELVDKLKQQDKNNDYEHTRLAGLLADSNQSIILKDQQLAQQSATIDSLQSQLSDHSHLLKQSRHQLSLSKSVTQSIQKQNIQDLKRREVHGTGAGTSNGDSHSDSSLFERTLYQSQQAQSKLTQENAQWRDTFNLIGSELSDLTTETTKRVELLTGNVIHIDDSTNSKPPTKQTKDRLLTYLKTLKHSMKLLSGQKTFNFVDDYDFEKIDVLKSEYLSLKSGLDGLSGASMAPVALGGVDTNIASLQDTQSESDFYPRRSTRLNLSDLQAEQRDVVEDEIRPRKAPRKAVKVSSSQSLKRRPSAAAGTSKLADVRRVDD